MCYNLGADTNLDPFVYKSINDTTSRDIKGWLFQWGRTADGHQWRSSDTITGPYSHLTNIQVPSGDKMYGKFIKNPPLLSTYRDWRTPQYDIAWRNFADNNSQPCPSGWRIPTSDEWGSLYREGSGYGAPAAATANAWLWTTSGYELKPDGITPTLFLPAGGDRTVSGTMRDVGINGYYWSCTALATCVNYFLFGASSVIPINAHERGYGDNVRCISTELD
jgi:uncharacterized protein (TIGR02145 family)